MSSSEEPQAVRQDDSEERVRPHKVFVTQLDPEIPLPQLEEQLRKLFNKFGETSSVVAKKSYNGEYCYAFIEFQDGVDASDSVKQLHNQYVGTKRMRVQLQQTTRDRKGGSESCFKCHQAGHFARNCPVASEPVVPKRRESRRRDSSSRSRDARHKQKKAKRDSERHRHKHRKHKRSSSGSR